MRSEARNGRSVLALISTVVAFTALLLPAFGSRAVEAGGQAKKVASVPALDPTALDAVQRMADRIVGAKALSTKGEIAWESVQADGQLLEFGALRDLVLERPDRLRVDVTLREGGKRRLLYDGKRVVVEDLDQNVYAITPASGSVYEVAAFVSNQLSVPVALAEFLSPYLPSLLTQMLLSATDVGVETIDGIRTRHVALKNAVGGLELWIGEEDSLPRRITIRYEHAPGQPRFQARFTEWNLSPETSDATFAFEPPQGAERIAFVARTKGGAR